LLLTFTATMGNSHSKRSRITTYPAERKRRTGSRGSDLTLTSSLNDGNDATPTINVATVTKWEDKLLSDPKVVYNTHIPVSTG
jgi:hypothetical protein